MKKKILIVDGKSEFRTILQIILHGNYDVLAASDGLNALDMLYAGYYPDLIICELMMSFVDGESFVQQLKASDIFKYIPVIIISSVDNRERKIEEISYGASDYVDKPFNSQEIRERINRLLCNTG